MTKAVWRPTMTSDVVFELVDLLEQVKRTTGLSANLRQFLSKLDSLAYDIGKGNRAPAYVATGIKDKSKISLENLGADSEEFQGTNAGNVTPTMLAPSTTSNNSAAKLGAELDDEMAAELERINAEMLAEVAGNGAGADNVILHERRKHPRNTDPLDAAIDVSQL